MPKKPRGGSRAKRPNRRTAPRRASVPRRKKTSRKGLITAGAILLLVAALGYLVYLDDLVRGRFSGALWSLPAHVFARPQELYAGLPMSIADLRTNLETLGYRPVASPNKPGEFSAQGLRVEVITRPFRYWDSQDPSRHIGLSFQQGRLREIASGDSGAPIGVVRLEPVRIASIYPTRHEDRLLVDLSRVPPLLVDALLAVEDRDFFDHWGVSPRGIGRALLANLRSGKTVQGGSTLTQQLVKNLFLSSRKSIVRKLNEALMALLLEWHFEKEQILEAYLNEVFLGQDGTRAIHGFGLASRYYFNRPLWELETHQIALLVGLVKGPSYYDPWRHPDRAQGRRELVLNAMAETGLISPPAARGAAGEPLSVSASGRRNLTAYPAYLDLVKRQLRRDYREEDLQAGGLRIFTHLDRHAQAVVEDSLSRRLEALEQGGSKNTRALQGAVVVADHDNGEVIALSGDRRPRFFGFNRALDARRPIGSLIKPAVYLTALRRPKDYTLASLLDDGPFAHTNWDGSDWTPANYDQKSHGRVPMFEALANSYNIATTRLGMELGLSEVARTVGALGVGHEVPAYPSVLLGALELAPFEVAQMYQAIAAGGFVAPLRSINAVLSADGEPLRRYPLAIDSKLDTKAVFLVNEGLRRVVRDGTGRSLTKLLPAGIEAAGKTGTTNDLRDSWFAGYSGRTLAVVWVGRDDNQSAGLTGATGAMRLWADIMSAVPGGPLGLREPPGIEWAWIETATGRRSEAGCPGVDHLPFIRGTVPVEHSTCRARSQRGPLKWLKGIFE